MHSGLWSMEIVTETLAVTRNNMITVNVIMLLRVTS